MFCPGCGLQVSDDLKFCRKCGANLHGAREGMMSRSTGEKFDWSKTWVADMFLTEEERERRRGVTAEEKRLNEIKGGVITSLVGVGVMIFLHFLFHEAPIDNPSDKDETLSKLWMAGIIPFLVGIGLLINGFFVSRRLVKLKEQQLQTEMPPPQAPAALPAKTTDQLVVDATLSNGASVTEDPTAHLPEPVRTPLRREAD